MTNIDQPDEVSRRAGQVASLTADAAAWLERNRAGLKSDPGSLIRDFRRSSRRAERLSAAALRPVGVAVFGASQSGKSYLVSRLCAGSSPSMTVNFGGETVDFLRDINPAGGQESTGLVSRFTASAPVAPRDAPVALRLLSQTDLIQIFANTFLEDFDADIELPSLEALDLIFAAANERAGPVARDALGTADVEELAEYFERYFRGHALLGALNVTGFWRRAAEVAPRLAASDRAALFAPLWGGVDKFTAICGLLIGALAALNFVTEAFCGLDALTPRETSIIDVRTLFELGGQVGQTLTVRSRDGVEAALARPVLAALVAEVIIPVSHRPFAFLDHADLLDFPGARTREAISDVKRFLADPGRIGRAFLRGKVAYLFQRYSAEQEIAAMLLCVGPGNQEVQTLPRMVTDWISSTMGDTPDARARQRNSLFLVLTKFDFEFEEKIGDQSPGLRWTTRLQASLLDFFGKSDDWPHHWVPGQAFDQIFWLRNPAIKFGAVLDYQANGAEIGIGERAKLMVQGLRTAYLENDLVKRHIAQPAVAWDSALMPNDGGISRLANALGPVCVRALKCNQLMAQTAALSQSVTGRLRMHWRSDDKAAEVSKAREQASALARALVNVTKAQCFGALLLRLGVSPDLVSGVLWRMELAAVENIVPIGIVAGGQDLELELGPEILGGMAGSGSGPARDRFDQFADMLLAAWQDQVTALTRHGAQLQSLALDPEQAIVLVDGLSAAAKRLALADQIGLATRRHGSFHGAGALGDQRVARIAEEIINNFIAFLGFDATAETNRPQVGNPPRPVFGSRPSVRGLPELGISPAGYDLRFYADWIRSIVEVLIANAESGADLGFDRAANGALGTLLSRFAALEAE